MGHLDIMLLYGKKLMQRKATLFISTMMIVFTNMIKAKINDGISNKKFVYMSSSNFRML